MPLGPNTMLTLTITVGNQKTVYTAYMIGTHPYGLRLTPPQILTQTFAPPVGTKMVAAYDAGIKLAEFDTEVVGYLNTQPPSMIVAPAREVRFRERRNSPRVRVNVPVTYTAKGQRFVFERTTTYDMSIGGLCMVTQDILPVNNAVKLDVELPRLTLKLDGRIAWSSFRDQIKLTGIQFVNVPTPWEDELVRFLFASESRQASAYGHKPE